MGRRGRKLVEEKYSVEIVAKKKKAVYDWVAGKGEKPEWEYE